MSAPPSARRPRRPVMDERIRARRRQVSRARARRRRRVTLSVLGLVVLVALAGAVARSPLFAIAEVRVDGVAGQQVDEVRAAAGLAPGQNLLSADLRAAADRVRALDWVRDAAVERVPPSVVAIRVLARVPVVVVYVADAAWLVDAEGVVVAGGAREGLVAVDAPNSVLPGAGIRISDAAVRNALAVHAELPADLRGRVDRYEAPGARSLRLRLRLPSDSGLRQDRVWVRFGAAERVVDKARVVQALLAQARAQARRSAGPLSPGIAEIDVRAPENPVLVPAGR